MDRKKLEHLPLSVRQRWHGMSKSEQAAEVEKYEKELPDTLRASIQKYVIEERKKGVPVRKIKKRVLKKFGIVII